MQNAGLDEAQAGIKIAGININNNFRYAHDINLMAESEEDDPFKGKNCFILFVHTHRLAQQESFRAEVLEPVGSYCVHGPMPNAVEVEDGSG